MSAVGVTGLRRQGCTNRRLASLMRICDQGRRLSAGGAERRFSFARRVVVLGHLRSSSQRENRRASDRFPPERDAKRRAVFGIIRE
jgi:hypothetical protein